MEDAVVEPICRLYLDPHDQFTRVVQAPVPAGRFPSQTISNISVNYTGFTPQAQAAFQAAVEIWQTQLGSSVPLVVDASFTSLGANVLGSAGFTGVSSSFPNIPRAATFFPIPIVNKLAGADRNGASAEISARFNSGFTWYYGTDGLTPSGQVDFISVVLHELGHGLGFIGSASVSALGSGAINSTPYIYDVSVVDGAAVSILDPAAYPNPSPALGALLTSGNVFWNGANGKGANAGTRPKLYAPATYASGSTYSHVDEATYPSGTINSLMTPILGYAEAIHVPGPIVAGIFNDSGWGSVCSLGLDHQTQAIAAASLSLKLAVSAAPGCNWTATTPHSFVRLTSGSSATGAAVVRFTIDANTALTQRQGTIVVSAANFSETQSLTITQAGTQSTPCTYGLSGASTSVVAAGGSFNVGVTAGAGCAWTASTASSFVTLAPAAGSGNGVVAVTAAANLSTTARSATLTIAGQAHAVTQAGQPGPVMTTDRGALNFGAATTGAGFAARTPPQGVRVTQGGPAGVVTWTAAANQPWLTVTPAAGSGSAALSVGVQFAAGLPAVGAASGAVTITYAGASSVSSAVAVTLNLAMQTGAPFGAFDTPDSGPAALQGSIAVTGWALDDVGVSRVEIWRDVQPGEPTVAFIGTPADPRNGKVYVADALFVEGARPDVEAAYGALPVNYRAGWGYLLLTQGLFNQGNGTYVLSAFAFDEESKVSTLGQKTIVVSNQTATRPFGSIDTPGIGSVSAGTAVNFGWALTPPVAGVATCRIGPGGVQVSIDSGPLQPVTFGALRQDIALRFPGLANSSDAGGSFVFDTTALTNGTHTIVWLVTDNCNRADGIGSRFFSVSNGSLAPGAEASSDASRVRGRHTTSVTPITLSMGFGELPLLVQPDASGDRTVAVRQGERIAVRLPPGFEQACQLVNGERRPLPAGVTWDRAVQAFYWQPAAPFLGEFQFVFDRDGEVLRLLVVISKD